MSGLPMLNSQVPAPILSRHANSGCRPKYWRLYLALNDSKVQRRTNTEAEGLIECYRARLARQHMEKGRLSAGRDLAGDEAKEQGAKSATLMFRMRAQAAQFGEARHSHPLTTHGDKPAI